MAEQGGYRKPDMPAPVSGPGAFSQRTDGQPGTTPKQASRYVTGLPQGEGKAFNEQVVGAAPLAASANAGQPSTVSQAMPTLPNMPPSLDAPTANPNEPGTAGAPFGAGVNSLPMSEADLLASDAMTKKAVDTLTLLEKVADKQGSNSAIRQMVRRLRGNI